MHPPSYSTLFERTAFYATWAFTALVLLFLMAPIIAVMPLSFNAEPYFSYPMPGLSLQWYQDFFTNDRWTKAVVLSLELAACVTVCATILGTLAALEETFRPLVKQLTPDLEPDLELHLAGEDE